MTTPFSSLDDFQRLLAAQPTADPAALEAATARNASLTKPAGALGRLEEISLWYASWRQDPRPRITAPQIVIFAGNHGITARGVSAFPAEVTEQMVLNFQSGGAAINQLAQSFGARLDVVALDLSRPTADFTQAPAMSDDEFLDALRTGWNAVDPSADLFVTGEMGIGNTTSAAALAAGLFGGAPEDWTGRGTGVDDAGLARKAETIALGLARHKERLGNPLATLQALGGRELAAMAGAIAGARHHRIPVLLDGFICTAAAACLAKAQPGALDHCLAAHISAEAAHGALLEALGLKPLLALDLRLGEGSGAALAIGTVQAALNCHSGMASFAEAGVSDAPG